MLKQPKLCGARLPCCFGPPRQPGPQQGFSLFYDSGVPPTSLIDRRHYVPIKRRPEACTAEAVDGLISGLLFESVLRSRRATRMPRAAGFISMRRSPVDHVSRAQA